MKTLKKFEFKSFGGDRSAYDWDKILDGGIYQLAQGAEGSEEGDYQCKNTTFGTLARNAGRARGKTVKVGTVEGGLVIQAEDASADQIAAWATADEERKAKAAAKRAEKKAETAE